MSGDAVEPARSPSSTAAEAASPLCGCFTGLRKISEEERGRPVAPRSNPKAANLHSRVNAEVVEPVTVTQKVEDEQPFALLHSSMCGIVDAASTLLLARASVEERDLTLGRTALMWAAQRGHVDAVRLLLASGASVCDIDAEGRSALMLSAEAGCDESARLLLDSRAAVDDRCHNGMTALMYAATEGRLVALSALLDVSANINAHDDTFGMTPIMWAAVGGQVDGVSLLLDRRARTEVKDSDGRTALMHAAERGSLEVVNLLLESGSVRLDEADPLYGRTALDWAENANQTETVRLLMQSRAKVDMPTDALAGDAAAGSYLQSERARVAANTVMDPIIEDSGVQKLGQKGSMTWSGDPPGVIGRDELQRLAGIARGGYPTPLMSTQSLTSSLRNATAPVGPRVLYGAMDGFRSSE